VTTACLLVDEIGCRNCRYSRSRPRPAAVLAAEDDMIVVVVVVKVVERFEFVDVREQSPSNGICR
jgi:hypothetical protein